jgi:hypothetical protein
MVLFTSIALTVLTVASVAHGQQQCNNGPYNIQSNGDVSQISNCQDGKVTGDVVLGESVTTVTLTGVQEITGSLTCVGATNLTSLSAPSLQSIGNQFELTRLTLLSNLQFPELTTVGSIAWTTLPALQQLTFTSKVTMATDVLITDTFLTSLDGIDLQVVDTFNINNNNYLTDVNLQLGNVTTALNVDSNAKGLTATFPNLIWAFNMTFRQCAGINVPSLAAVNGSMGLISNSITGFSAPNLTTVGQSLSFVDNTQLTNISLPQLTIVDGTFQIANNTEITSIEGFPKLATVGGAIDFSGNFTKADLPALSDVRGGFNLQSSGTIDCDGFNTAHNNGVIKGSKYVCKGNQATPGTAGSTSTSTGSSPKKTGAAGRVSLSSTGEAATFAFVAGLLGLAL